MQNHANNTVSLLPTAAYRYPPLLLPAPVSSNPLFQPLQSFFRLLLSQYRRYRQYDLVCHQRLSNVRKRISRPSCEPLYAKNTSHRKQETFLYEYRVHWVCGSLPQWNERYPISAHNGSYWIFSYWLCWCLCCRWQERMIAIQLRCTRVWHN
jgi:hypothetical protein